MRDIELKVMALGVHQASKWFHPVSCPTGYQWTRYLQERLAQMPWVETFAEVTVKEEVPVGVLGAATLTGSLAVSADREAILAKLNAGEEVLATIFTLPYRLDDVRFVKNEKTQTPDLTQPMLGLIPQEGHPQLVRLCAVGAEASHSTGVLKGLNFQWAVSPVDRKAVATFSNPAMRRRFIQTALPLGVYFEHVALVPSSAETVLHYRIPAEVNASALWEIIWEQQLQTAPLKQAVV